MDDSVLNKDLKCKDCIHSKTSWFNRMIDNSYRYECTAPEAYTEETYDPVCGKVRPGYNNYCSTMRSRFGKCGPGAKLWKARNTKLVFTILRNT